MTQINDYETNGHEYDNPPMLNTANLRGRWLMVNLTAKH